MSKSGKERLNLKCLKTGTGYIVTRPSQLSEVWISGADNYKNSYSSIWLPCRNRLIFLDNFSFLLGVFWVRMEWVNYFGFLPDLGRWHKVIEKKRLPWAVTPASYFWSRQAFLHAELWAWVGIPQKSSNKVEDKGGNTRPEPDIS